MTGNPAFWKALSTTSFFLLEGRWITPPASLGLLPGICRAWVLERGLAVEAPIQRKSLARVEAVAAANSVFGLAPVCQIEDCRFSEQAALGLRQSAGPREYEPLTPMDH